MIQKNSDTMSFHLQLLSKFIDINAYPFTKIVIENNINAEEYRIIFQLLDDLNNQFNMQMEEGLMDFTSLLVQFAGMLTEKLTPNKVIYALKQEGYYPRLMNEFIQIIEDCT